MEVKSYASVVLPENLNNAELSSGCAPLKFNDSFKEINSFTEYKLTETFLSDCLSISSNRSIRSKQLMEAFSNIGQRSRTLSDRCSSKSSNNSISTPSTPFVVSYGIACVRKNSDTGNYEVLMIKKKATYSFIDFLRGRYDPMRHYDLEFMFNEMTINEKVMIRSKNFTALWMYCWGSEPSKSSDKSMYMRSFKKFTQLCNYRDGSYLMELLNKSSNSELIWEIPKGRVNKNESTLESAIREFEEETGIKKDDYQLLFNEGTIEYTFIDAGIKYKYVYYLAIMNNVDHPKYDYNNEHMILEVSELKFLPSNAVYEFNNQRLYKTVRIIIKKLKKYFRNT